MGISNYIPNSSLAKPGVCTSSTRPASPYEGQYIHETDTDKLLFWNGSAWYPNWNVAWGVVDTTSGGTSGRGYRTTLTNQTVNQGVSADLTNSSMTFTAISGRLYRYTVHGYAASTSASGICNILIKDGSTTVNEVYMNITNSLGAGVLFASAVLTGSGSKTVKVTCTSNTGNTLIGGSSNYGYYILEDIGPA